MSMKVEKTKQTIHDHLVSKEFKEYFQTIDIDEDKLNVKEGEEKNGYENN